MCGNGRRAAHYQHGCGRGYAAQRQAGGVGGTTSLAAIIGAIQELKLAGHGIDSRAPLGMSQPLYPGPVEPQYQGVERGVVHDTPYLDEKTHPAQKLINFEVLPSYEESTGPRERQPPTDAPPSVANQALPQNPQGTSLTSQEAILSALESFRQSLLAYRRGTKGAKYETKTAAKRFVRDLFDQEMARRKAEKGHLECGERKLVKRELKPVKQMLKSAMWEARQERMGRV